jgi:hypothetical protein
MQGNLNPSQILLPHLDERRSRSHDCLVTQGGQLIMVKFIKLLSMYYSLLIMFYQILNPSSKISMQG